MSGEIVLEEISGEENVGGFRGKCPEAKGFTDAIPEWRKRNLVTLVDGVQIMSSFCCW